MLELLIVLALIVAQRLLRAVGDGADDLAQAAPEADGRGHSRGARKALALAEHPDNLLSTVQVGITLIGVLTGVFGGEAIGLVIAGWLEDVWPAAREYARADRHRHRGRP